MAVLNAEEIQEKLQFLPGWKLENGEIERSVNFKDFVAAVSFVNQVAAKAEAAGHHPDIDIRYNNVRLALASHDAGGLTQADFDLAASIEGLLAENARS